MNVNNRRTRGGIFAALVAFALFLLFTVSAFAADLTSTYTWKPVKIGAGGWMRGMMVHPANANIRYARGDVDNIYRWDNTNSTWVPLQVSGVLPASVTGAPGSAGAGPIAIDPNNQNIVLCGWHLLRSADIQGLYPDSNFSVYRSTNGGLTFTASNLSLPGTAQNPNASDESDELRGERMMIDPNNGNVVYLGSKIFGLWRSMDGGLTWSNVTANGAPGATSAALLPRFDKGGGTITFSGQTVTKRIYVTMDAGPVLQSDDGGNSWTNISTGQDADGRAGFTTVDQNGRLIICNTQNGYIDIRTRAGVWTAVQPSYGPVAVTVDPTNANRMFTIGGGGALARSLDGGSTWVGLGGGMNFSATQQIQWLRPNPVVRPNGHFESCSGIYIDSVGKLWVCGGNDGIQTCTPNDATDSVSNPPVWSSNSQGIEEMVTQAMTIPPGGNLISMFEDESLFTIFNPDLFTAQHHTLDLWTNNTGLSLGQDVAYCPNQPHFIAETSDNGFYGREPTAAQRYSGYSTDGGLTWNKFASIANGTNPCSLYCGLIAISARQSGHQNDGPGADNIVWAGANVVTQNAPAPFYSTNGGASWIQTHSFDTQPGASQGQRCGVSYTYMGFQNGPWTNLLHQHNLEPDPLTPGTFYFNVTNNGFWKSTDGGATWTKQAGSSQIPGAMHQGQLRANPNASGDLWLVDGYEGADAHGLYHTTNGGASFTRNAAFTYAWELALGKSSTVGGYPAIYVYGLLAGDPNWGVFRTTDTGSTWDRVSFYPTGLIDAPASMTASWDTFGQVYVGFNGDNIVYGAPSGSQTVPPAPTNLTATAGNTLVTLGWFASPGATSYNVYRGATAGGENGTAIATNINGVTYTNTGLTNGTAYYYKVTATNSIGTSGYSNEANATPAPQPPLAPANVMALAGDTQISITWAAASGATSYNVYCSTTAGGETLLTSGIAATSYTNTGLTNGTTYYYKVAGVNTTGTGALSAEASAKPSAANGNIAFASSAPTIDGTVDAVWSGATSYNMPNVTGTIPGGATNTGSWQALWDSTNLYVLVSIQDSTVLANNDSIEIYVDGSNGKAGAYTNVDWQWVFTNGSATVQEYSGGSPGGNTAGIVKADGALAGGWRLEAKIPWSTVGVSAFASDVIGLDVVYNNFNVTGTRANKLFWFSTADNDWTNPALFGTAKLIAGSGGTPTAPTGLTATAGDAQVMLSWNASGGATSYSVLRSTVSGSGYASVATGIATTSYTNTGLTDGTTYYFVATATNASGTSGNSGQASATPVAIPAPPTGLTATPTSGQVALSWSASTGATSYNVLRSTVSGSGYANVVGQGGTSYTNTGLSNGTTYYYVVNATNASGSSANSTQVSATPSSGGGTTVVQINAGGVASGTWIADADFVGGNTSSTANAIDTTAVTNPAPQSVYQTDRWANPGTVTYTIPGLTANTSYTVRLHFSENYFTAAGLRKFNVTIQGTQVLTNFDIFATAGAQFKANVQQFTATSNGSGQMIIAFVDGAVDHAKVNGIEILTSGGSIPAAPTGLTATPGNAQVVLGWNASTGATTYNVKRSTVNGSGYTTVSSPATASYTNTGLTNGTTYYYVVTAVNASGESGNSAQASATPSAGGVAVIQINAGAGGTGTWVTDTDYSGGNTSSTVSSIDTTAVTNPAPVAVYQANRWGAMMYTIPGLTAGANYTVRLHFSESYQTAANLRKFNVTIQGTQVLTNFDIFATAGAMNKANIQQFVATANGSGQIVINFTLGTVDQPLISGIEVLTIGAPPSAPTGLTATAGNSQVALSWTASGGATSYNVKRSTVSGSGYALVASPTTTSYTNSGLTNATAYYFVVSAVNGAGESANSSQASATPYKVAIAPGTATIDGTIEAAWNNATAYTIGNTIFGTAVPAADISGTFKAMWDSTNLYVLFQVTDDVKKNDSAAVWDDDEVEVFVDGNYSHGTTYDGVDDVQWAFGWGDSTVVEGSGPAGKTTGITFAKADPTGTTYVIEIKIPWSTIGGTASTGRIIGFDGHINDDDDGGVRDNALAYSDTNNSGWSNPSVFACARLN